MHRLVPLAVACLLCGCAASAPACLLPAQKPMLMIELYFGRDIEGRASLTEAEWSVFTRAQITPRFPAGFTVIDAQGQWFNPATRRIAAEATKVVRIAALPGPDTAARIQAVADAYRTQFHQIAVGMSSAPVCAAF